jgi:hypothetical protein
MEKGRGSDLDPHTVYVEIIFQFPHQRWKIVE